MFRKTKQAVRKYPGLFFLVASALIALGFDALYKDSLARLLLLITAATALVPAVISMNRTLRSGFFGINLLPVTALITALLLQQGWTALVIALILLSEKPLISILRGKPSELISASHAPYAKLLDSFNVPFTMMVLLIAGALWILTGDALRFLEIITVASPAPLLLAVPLSFMTGLKQVRTQRVFIRSAGILERLASTESVLLSKNGILTLDTPKVDTVRASGDSSKSEVLHIAAVLASQSQHPLARAIILEAQESSGITKAKHAVESPGMGLTGRQKGQTLLMGRAELLESEGVKIPATFAAAGDTITYVAADGRFLGSISFKDDYRESAGKLALELRKMGIRAIQLVSGDTVKAVAAAAKYAGIKTFHGNLRASDKIRLVQDAAPRPVAFVGHADSDAAALTAADVSIVFGEHQTGSSDISVEDSSLSTLIGTFRAAKQTLRKARITSLVGLLTACVLIGLAAINTFSPLQSAGLQALVAFLTIISATYVKLQTTEK